MSVQRTLYHFPLDPASRQVRLALGEKRLAFEDVVVRYWEQPDDLSALNPSGLTPVLVEEGPEGRLVLCESRAILDYLEERHPEPALLGREAADRAEARRLLQWFDRKFDYEVGSFLLHEKMEKRLLRMGGAGSGCPAPRPRSPADSPDLSGQPAGRAGLAGRSQAQPGGFRRGGASFGDRLFRRRALAGLRRRQDVVHDGEIPALLPAAARRSVAGARACGPL